MLGGAVPSLIALLTEKLDPMRLSIGAAPADPLTEQFSICSGDGSFPPLAAISQSPPPFLLSPATQRSMILEAEKTAVREVRQGMCVPLMKF